MAKICKTIIVVDDNEADLIIEKNALNSLYIVIAVPSAKTLFLLLENVIPDLILLNAEMSGANGLEILGDLKRLDATARVPVILLTKSNDPQKEKAGFAAGAADYLTKPFSRELLLKRIEMHLLVGSGEGKQKHETYYN